MHLAWKCRETRMLVSEICDSEFVTGKSRTISCRLTIFMLRKENTLPVETLKTKSDDFETTRDRGPPVICGHSKTNWIRAFNGWTRFYPMLIVAPVTHKTNNVRIILHSGSENR